MTKINHTSKQQPEGSPPHFTFNELEAFIGRLLVHAKGNSNVGRFTKSCVLCCIVAFAEVIYTVAKKRIGNVTIG